MDNSAALEIEKCFVSIDKSLMQGIEEMFKKYSTLPTFFFLYQPSHCSGVSYIMSVFLLLFFFFSAVDPSHCELLLSISLNGQIAV